MRIFLLSILTLLFFGANAQDLTTDTMTYKGKLCYVYPYKFEWKKSYRGKKYYQENREIPPIFDSLPAGDYIMLHAFKPTLKNKWKQKHGKLEPIVGAEFKVDSGKLNGKVTYYYYNGQKRKEGYFYNGLKDGEWIFISTYYSKRKKQDVPYLRAIATYKRGVEEGLQKDFEVNEKPTLEYIKKGNGFVNYYKLYYPNGQLRLDLRADSVTELYAKSLWPLQFAGGLAYDTTLTEIDFSKMTQKEIKKYRKTHPYSYTRTHFDTDLYISDYARGYSLPSEIPFVMYHANGEVLGRFSGVSENDKWSLQFDTIYNPLKRPALIKVPLTDSADHARFRLDYYKANQTLVKQTYYVLDSSGVYQNYRRDKLIFGKMQTQKANYSYFYSNDWSGKKLDSLYLTSIENRYSTIDSSFMCPAIPDKTFESSLDSSTGYRTYCTILAYDSSMYKYKITAELGRVSVEGFYHNDTTSSPLAVLTIKDVMKRFIPSNGYHEDDEDEDYYRSKTTLDSMLLYLDKKPFSGKVIATNGKGEEAFVVKDGNIYFDITARLSVVSVSSYSDKFKLVMEFKNGRVLSVHDKGKNFESTFKFKNNMADGTSTGYYTRKCKRRLAFEINTKEGLYDGSSKLYAYKKRKTEKDDQHYYLKVSQNYSNGLLVDTNAHYYPNGAFEYFSVYNKQGKLNGNFCEYNSDGSLTYFRNFVDGNIDGVYFEINEIGDTVQKGYYVKGNEEGKFFREHYDKYEKIYDYRLWSTYHNGRLQGDLTLYDTYNTLRLQLKIDSGYASDGKYIYLDEERILNDWSDDIAFSGEVNVFHPNGKKYLNGRMLLKKDTLDVGEYSYSMDKIGTWTYNNTVERKIAELEFVKDAKLVFGTDTMYGTANYKAFYPDGKIKYEGILNYEDTRLNCATDIKEADFVATYNTFISAEGDTLVKNGTGRLKLYNADGNVISEGDIKNGKKTGWWKTYNDEGKLVEVGQYIADVKEGRWLFGDLTGINYLDAQCFQNEEEKQEEQEREKYKISIEEIIYDKGEEVSSQSYEFTRTK